ncbi:MAG: ferrous iron transport protein A [Gammaproteobacteria bacterium]|nr:ferrous iron transport protein A [Gammaproteobacteria bacterium]MBQ0839357.1 ferrous iron transport protein A [Gammaproteobacteria bacterium]
MSILQLAQRFGFATATKVAKKVCAYAEDATLADLKPGQPAQVLGFQNAEHPSAQRLMQLGMIKGELIELLRSAPGGDPIEYRVMGYNLSLRRAEAAEILVENHLG